MQYNITQDLFFINRYLQRCAVHILKSPVLPSIFELSLQGIHLDHREANTSVFKFLYELVHQGRRRVEKVCDRIIVHSICCIIVTVFCDYKHWVKSEVDHSADSSYGVPMQENTSHENLGSYQMEEFVFSNKCQN
jgi:hypothetical protein